jgi:pimeloyl-ACP methyl ester carboxylesterase
MRTSSGVPDVAERLDAHVLRWVDAFDHGPLRGPLRVAVRSRPRLAPWLLVNAGVIAYSRLYTARHFLSDLVVCGAIGAAVGVGTDRLVTLALDARGSAGRDEPLRRRWTVVDDRVLHSRETADAAVPGARPVLLLHGVGTTTRYHRPLLHALRGRIPAVAVELPGIGSSSSDRIPSSVAEQADVVADWLRATGRRPAAIVGNSMGAQTAVELAVRHPELAERVVLLGPTVDRRARDLPRQAVKLAVDATLERPSLLVITATDTFLTRRRAVNRYLRAALGHRIEERIALTDAPVVVVRGERDPLVPRRWARRLADAAPQGRCHEVPGAAHAVHHGRPEAVADLLVQVSSATR